MRRLGWILLLGIGLLVAVAVPAGWFLTRPPATVGARVAEALAAESPPAPTAGPPGAGGATGAARAAGVPGAAGADGSGDAGGGTDRAGLGAHAGGRAGGDAGGAGADRAGGGPGGVGAVPDRLDLPTLGVRAAVLPVGVDGDGDLSIPADVAEVGWYRFGARPGDPAGSTVLSGHVDSAEQGRGAFFRLRTLGPGDPILVHGSDGRTRTYRVVAREEWPKSEVPLDRLFARTGAARLTLVTCGGGFREDVGSYRDNVAVTAVPEGAT